MANSTYFVVVPFERTRALVLCRTRADQGSLPGSSARRSRQGKRGLLEHRRP